MRSPSPRAWAVLAAILLFKVGYQVALYRAGYFGLSADEYVRVDKAWPLLAGTPVRTDTWLPLHRWILAAAIALGGDLHWGPRVATLGASLLSLVFVYVAVRRLARSDRAGLIAALLAAAAPAHVLVSGTPLAESFFLASFAGACAAAIRFAGEQRARWALAASVAFAAGNLLRYESWVLSAVFGVWLIAGVVRRRQARPALELGLLVVAIVLPAIPAALWLLEIRSVYGSFGYAPERVAFMYRREYGAALPLAPTLLLYPGQMWELGRASLLLALGSLVAFRGADRRRLLAWLLPAAVLLVWLIVLALKDVVPTHHAFRPLAAAYLLLAGPAAWIVVRLADGRWRGARLAAAALGLVLCVDAAAATDIPLDDQPRDAIALGQFFRRAAAQGRLSASRPVLLEKHFWDYVVAQNVSGDARLLRFDRFIGPEENEPSLIRVLGHRLGEYVAKNRIAMIAVRDPALRSILAVEPALRPCASVGAYSLYCSDR